MNNPDRVHYLIRVSQNNVTFEEADEDDLYGGRSNGIVRKAIYNRVQSSHVMGRFTDREFPPDAPPGCRLVRLFDYYKRQVDLFPIHEQQSSYFTPQKQYNSFMGESGVVSYQYLRTLFLTQTVSEKGYYQYFVKRNGEYFVEECDDFIPVDKLTWKPIWGLDFAHPWQIMLFKAWWKQCRTIDNMYRMEPFQFLDAFGLPEYDVYNFRKELKFIRNERAVTQSKIANQMNLPMNNVNCFIIGRTVNSPLVEKVGLIPNVVGYRLRKDEADKKDSPFQLYSSLPIYWVGKYSPVYNSELNRIYSQGGDIGVNLERTFLITQQEMLTYFNKFYIAPSDILQPQNIVSQDCINLNSAGAPLWIRFNSHESGLFCASVVLPKVRGNNGKYPQLRYFFTRRNDQYEKSLSHVREDLLGASKLQQNMYITSSCDKWSYYKIDYIQGYENFGTFYCKVNPGEYVLFIQTDYQGPVNVRVDTFVKMDRPQPYEPSQLERKQIYDSTFFSISRDNGVEATFNQRTFDESITLNNSFEELGFGSVCIKTLQKAKHRVAMRVYPEKLRAAGYRTMSQYESIQGPDTKEKNYVFVSAQGKPQIIVLERISDRSRTSIGQVFPPPGTVQFFRVIPNTVNTVINAPMITQR